MKKRLFLLLFVSILTNAFAVSPHRLYESNNPIFVCPSLGGDISGSTTVCSTTNSTILTLSGHDGAVTKWQSSTVSDFSTATDIANTGTSLTVTNVTQTTYYRVVFQSPSCPDVYSSTAVIAVNPKYYIKVRKISENASTLTVQFELSSVAATAFDATATVKVTSGGGVAGSSYIIGADGFIGGSSAPIVMHGVSPSPTIFTFTKNTGTAAATFTIDDASDPNGYGVFDPNLGLLGKMCLDDTHPINCIISPSVSIGVSANPICAGVNTTFTATPNRHGGAAPTYQWLKGGSPILGANGPTYTTTSLANDDQISVVMTSDFASFGCVDTSLNIGAKGTSDTIKMRVNGVPGTPSFVAGATTICQDAPDEQYTATATNSTTISYSVSPSTAGTISTSGLMNWSSSFSGTATITATARGLCGTTVLDRAVTVAPTAVGGIIAGNTAVCTGTNSTVLTLSGHTGTVVKWQSSTDASFTNAVDILSATTSLTITNLTATTYYRAVVQSGVCSEVNSASSTVTVDPVAVGGTVAGTSTVCTGVNSTTLTLSGYTGTIVRWESSTNIEFTSPTDILNATTSLTTTNLTTTTYYRAVVQSGVCSSVNSAIATVTVDPTAVGGTIAGSTTVCTGTNSTVLTLSGHIGTVTKWQSSVDAAFTSPVDINNTTTSLTAIDLTATIYYRAVVQSGVCSFINSANATISVNPIPTATISASATTICSGTTATITFNGTANGIIVYKIDGGADQTISLNSTGSAFITTPALTLTSTTYTLVSVGYASTPMCTQPITGQSATVTFSACSTTLAAKVLIEGAYNTVTQLMNDGLRTNNKIPLNQPYNVLIFWDSIPYTGTETVTPSVLGIAGNNAIVDWVLIELRSATNRAIIVQRRAALLQRDGDVVDIDGVSPLKFDGLADGSYHVVVRHRLCLATRTQTAVSMSSRLIAGSSSTIVDFTTNINALLGSQKLVATGKYGLIIGDIDRNGSILAGDVSAVRINNPTTYDLFNYLTTGYDMDFNASIFSTDVAIIRPNNPRTQVDLAQ